MAVSLLAMPEGRHKLVRLGGREAWRFALDWARETRAVLRWMVRPAPGEIGRLALLKLAVWPAAMQQDRFVRRWLGPLGILGESSGAGKALAKAARLPSALDYTLVPGLLVMAGHLILVLDSHMAGTGAYLMPLVGLGTPVAVFIFGGLVPCARIGSGCMHLIGRQLRHDVQLAPVATVQRFWNRLLALPDAAVLLRAAMLLPATYIWIIFTDGGSLRHSLAPLAVISAVSLSPCCGALVLGGIGMLLAAHSPRNYLAQVLLNPIGRLIGVGVCAFFAGCAALLANITVSSIHYWVYPTSRGWRPALMEWVRETFPTLYWSRTEVLYGCVAVEAWAGLALCATFYLTCVRRAAGQMARA